MAAIFACLEKIFEGADAADAHDAISQHLDQAAKAGVPLADVLAQVATAATDKVKLSVHDAAVLAVQASTAQIQCGRDPYQQLLSRLCDCVGQAARAQTAAQTATDSWGTLGSAAAALGDITDAPTAEDWCRLAADRLELDLMTLAPSGR